MRVLVVDPGFSGHGGHHRAVSGELVKAARARGLRAQVLANMRLDRSQEVPFTVSRCLDGYPYHKHDGTPTGSARLFLSQNELFERSIRRAVTPELVRPNDVFVMHTAVPEHLLGLLSWHASLGRPDTSLRLILRFPPGFFRPSHQAHEEALARYALASWRDYPGNVRFFSDLDALSAHYTALSGLPFRTTPIAIDFGGLAPERRPPVVVDGQRRGMTWVFAGEARKDKGAELVPEAFVRHLERHPQDRLRMQTMKLRDSDRERLAALGDRVDLVDHPLYGEEYLRFVASGDAVLVPYYPPIYHLRTSHILLEALGMARPVITAAPSWMAEQVDARKPAVGAVMRRWNVDALVGAMDEVSRNLPALLANTWRAAPDVRAQNNAAALLDALLDGVQGATSPSDPPGPATGPSDR
jgi:hypothetical protein